MYSKKHLDNFYTDLRIHDVVFVVVSNVLAADEKDDINRGSMN